MERLTVLYDARCMLCRQVRAWLEVQPRFVEIDFMAARSERAANRFPTLDQDRLLDDLTVVANDRMVYRGGKAFVMCLWALREYRGLSVRLSAPHMLPLAEASFRWVSKNRGRSRFLRRLFPTDQRPIRSHS